MANGNFMRTFAGVLIFLATAVPSVSGDLADIGVSLSTSGKYKAMGSMQEKGFRLWETYVNSDDGILGRKVRIQINDDKSDPERAKSIYTKMIDKDNVDLVFGPYSSGITEAVLPITEKRGYPVLLSGASADRLWNKGYKYAFGVYTPAGKYTVGFLQMLVKKEIKEIAIVSADDSFSISISAGTKKWAERHRLKVLYTERFEKKRNDLSEIALKIKESGARAAIVCGHLDESVNMRLAFKKIAWYPEAFYSSVGPATHKFKDALGKDADLVFSSSQWEKEAGIHFPNGKKFIESFRKKYATEPSYHAATAYAAGMILTAAASKIGTIEDRKRLRDTFSAMDTMTLIGRYGVDRTGMQIRHFPLIVQWQGGVKKVVWPEKLKNAAPIFNYAD